MSKENRGPLPLLAYAKSSARLELFAKKLKFCCQTCDFTDPTVDIRLKETKRIYLNECIEFLKERKDVFVEPVYALSFALFDHNVLRGIPSRTKLYDPDRDDHIQDPAWTHLQLVYIYFIKLLDSPYFQSSKAKQFIDQSFVSRLVNLFSSDDEDERDHLRVTLHRIYAKFISLRAFMRKEISNKCLELVYEDLYLPGITELLEVLGSIINGYSSPIKEEHVAFLHQVLLPLHYLPKIKHFHPQLVYCIGQYFEKDPTVIESFMKKFIKRWPKTRSPKELRFLDELEELIDIIPPKYFENVQVVIFTQIAKCVRSDNSQVGYESPSCGHLTYAAFRFKPSHRYRYVARPG